MTGAAVTIPRAQAVPLRAAAAFFTVAVLLHNGDHLRRGGDSASPEVFWLGSSAMLIEIGVVALVFMRHRFAPLAAAIAGLQLAVGYIAVHFTPERSWFSDSFVSGGASSISVTAAALEAVSALALGAAGVLALRRQPAIVGEPLPLADAMRHPVVLAMLVGNAVIFAGALATRWA